MAGTIFDSLVTMLDDQSVRGVAGALGESSQSVCVAMQASIAAVLGCIASKCDDYSTLRKMLNLAPTASGDVSWSLIATSVSDPDSPLIWRGKHILPILFGASENAVARAVSAESGLRPGVTSTLMAMAAPVVISFLGKRIRDEGMTISGLGNILQQESATIRSALPAELSDLIFPRSATVHDAIPVVAQTVQIEESSLAWIVPIAVAALLWGLFWFHAREHRTKTGQINALATRAAVRLSTTAVSWGDFVQRRLPGNVDLNLPERGVESRLLSFIQDPNAAADNTTRFDFDQLLVNTGSATLLPGWQEQLDHIAVILKAYPNVRLKVGGYADNAGSAERNSKLAQDRAGRVVAELTGRAMNRGVSMCVTQK